MGSGESKDPNIDIYMQLDKPYYQAGEMVTGNVYLNAKMSVGYDALYIRFTGREEVYWEQHHQQGGGQHHHQHRVEVYQNSRESYQEQFILSKFNGSVPMGHYTFPFQFLLPNGLTGSFERDSQNFIRYSLSSYLTSFKEKKDNQTFTIKMTILQNLRMQYGPLLVSQVSNPKCCGCCANYGHTKVTLMIDKNALRHRRNTPNEGRSRPQLRNQRNRQRHGTTQTVLRWTSRRQTESQGGTNIQHL